MHNKVDNTRAIARQLDNLTCSRLSRPRSAGQKFLGYAAGPIRHWHRMVHTVFREEWPLHEKD
jgi:hypothetical protein